MRALGLVLLILVSGAAAAHAPRVDERAYAAAGLVSTCAPPVGPPPPANVNDICFQLQPGETSWILRIHDAQLAPVGARIVQTVTTTSGASSTATTICGEGDGAATWDANVVRIVLNVDLGTPGACARATAGLLRLEAYHDD